MFLKMKHSTCINSVLTNRPILGEKLKCGEGVEAREMDLLNVNAQFNSFNFSICNQT